MGRMEPMEVNAGRFYCRPLRHDSRVDDAPALTALLSTPALFDAVATGQPPESIEDFLTAAIADWETDRVYRFAVAEQTNVALIAVATVVPFETTARVSVVPVGDSSRVLPNDDEVLEKVTVADGVSAAHQALSRWAEGFLGKQVVA